MTTTPNTNRLAADRSRWVAAGTAGRPFFVARASGARIWDVDGREFIDFVDGIDEAFHRGLILMGAGVYSNCIRVLVPLVATQSDIDEGMAILDQALGKAG